jgi:predicted nucleic acid-binding protein
MIFLDSSFLVAFEVDGDSNHASATKVMREVARGARGSPVISDYVFDEVVTVTFVRTKSLSKARLVGDGLLESFRMLRVSDEVFKEAWQRFRNQKGTRLSFTDSTTVELMMQNEIDNIATFDRGFQSAGEFAVLGPE